MFGSDFMAHSFAINRMVMGVTQWEAILVQNGMKIVDSWLVLHKLASTWCVGRLMFELSRCRAIKFSN